MNNEDSIENTLPIFLLILFILISTFFTFKDIIEDREVNKYCIEKGYEGYYENSFVISNKEYYCYKYEKHSSGIGYESWSIDSGEFNYNDIKKDNNEVRENE